ncbi:MAG: glycoside hydrolase family 3 C-terminal domain-containing protein [Acidimicrobiia bacterium]|nr:glycoside hydrolase family 3 C-terminal domain-containing protein [Acidimicrobiia bacterium]
MTSFPEAAADVAAGGDPRAAAAGVVAAMTPEERQWCLDGDVPFGAGLADLATGGYHKRPFPAARVDRVGVPGFAFSDGPRGVVIGPATCFPVSMARGATWDVDLEERIGDAIGKELRAVGADLYGGVCVNVLRHPAWGRAQETYGEDPFHVGEMGAALTRGVQRHAMACVKHFACNSMENARFKVDVAVDEVALHEVFLPHFRRIVDEGAAVVMSAYNSVNGEWCGQNRALLTDVLRDEWGFDGFVISDWIFGLRDAGPSLSAGLDVEMPYRMVRAQRLGEALASGEATADDVDAAATRIVATLLRFADVLVAPRPGADVLACPEHRALAREVAARSAVLLRNEPVDARPVLPLDSAGLRKVAVVGRLAAVRNLGDGGSSDVWAPDVVTVLEGLREALPAADVVHHDGSDVDAAAATAAEADVAIVVVGYTRADEGEFIGTEGTAHLTDLMPGADDEDLAERFAAWVAAQQPDPEPPADIADVSEVGFATGGDRTSLRLHPEHEALIASVAAANPRTIVAVVAGSAVVMPWAGQVPAVLQSWYSGMEGGRGLADVLVGDVDASGRLPFTVPVDEADLPAFDRDADAVVYDRWHGWWKLERDGRAAAYPFGFGLSYTAFQLTSAAAEVGDELVVRASVRNAGSRRGSEVVQVYGGHENAAGTGRPARRLLAFARVEVEPGAEEAVELSIPIERLAVRDPERHAWRVEPGTYVLDVARHAADAAAHRVTVEVKPPAG